MVTFTQLRTTDEILTINDCYSFTISPSGIDDPEIVHKVAVIQLLGGKTERQILVRMQIDGEDTADSGEKVYPERDIAASLADLFIGKTVLSDIDSVRSLRSLLNRYQYEGDIDFLPVSRLSDTLFPDTAGLSLSEKAEVLSLPISDNPDMRDAAILAELLKTCQRSLNGHDTIVPAKEKKKVEKKDKKTNKFKLPSLSSSGKKTISNKTLRRWADSAWKISPWIFAAIAAVIVLLVILMIPHGDNKEIDRTVAPNSYLVLSWNETGSYGVKQKGSDDIHFNLPYGVYNVLNNNSIPIELNIYGGIKSQTLASDDGPESQKVTIRPNSSREITVDTEQYITLSEDAVDLIFFYVSAVPEEIEETTTGQVAEHQVIVYGYIKGTDVRFRNAPSLEGNIIQTVNNGQQVQILGVTGEWTYVMIQDQKGYIFSDYVSTEPVE